VRPIPIYDADAPIACTIGAEEIPERVALVERMRSNLARIDRTEHGLLLRFANRDDIDADVRQFAVDEKRCCAFWGFAVDATEDAITLRWDGPPATGELLDQLRAWFDSDDPITAISGLL
jgi:hypothetical protein